MAKYILRQKARKLRRQGISVKRISTQLGVSKSTVSLWVRDISLSSNQLESLKFSSVRGAALGSIRSALLRREKKLKMISNLESSGKAVLVNLQGRELLIAGLALYWGEGNKKGKEFSFCNSDPEMIKFLILWLQKCFSVSDSDLKCSVGINEAHLGREAIVREYWSNTLGIPLSQFTKTSLKKVKNQKVYENFAEHYGTIRIRIVKSGLIYYKILGLIEGLKFNMPT